MTNEALLVLLRAGVSFRVEPYPVEKTARLSFVRVVKNRRRQWDKSLTFAELRGALCEDPLEAIIREAAALVEMDRL